MKKGVVAYDGKLWGFVCAAPSAEPASIKLRGLRSKEEVWVPVPTVLGQMILDNARLDVRSVTVDGAPGFAMTLDLWRERFPSIAKIFERNPE